jgi:hypothetical protein
MHALEGFMMTKLNTNFSRCELCQVVKIYHFRDQLCLNTSTLMLVMESAPGTEYLNYLMQLSD